MLGKIESLDFSHEEKVEHFDVKHVLDGEEIELPVRRRSIGSDMSLICIEGIIWEYRCPHCGFWHSMQDQEDFVRLENVHEKNVRAEKVQAHQN